MRILHLVSYAVFSGPLPGVLALAQAQRRQGDIVYIAHDAWRGNFSPFEPGANAPMAQAQMAPPWPLALSAKGGLWRAGADLVTLRRVIRDGAIDVLHCHLSHDHLLAALAVGPRSRPTKACHSGSTVALVRTLHAARAAKPRLGSGWMWARTHGRIVRCQQDAAAAQRLGLPGAAAQHLIPGAIDAAPWDSALQPANGRDAWRTRHGIPADAPVLAHVALMAGRGQQELIAAWAALLLTYPHGAPRPHLVLVGRGPEQGRLAALAEAPAVRGHVHLLGYLAGPKLAAMYGAVDAAFAAQPGNDGAARAALEAMAAGLPVLAVPVGSLAELIHGGVGYLCASREPQTLAATVRVWLGDLAAGRDKGAAGRTWLLAARTPEQEAHKTRALYAAALVLANRHETG